jgi:hypothetical protein
MRNLSKTIRKNILEVKETKNNLIQESNIIKNRFNVILGPPRIKSKNEMIRLLSKVVKESVKLRELNHNSELINENLLDLFNTLFKDGGGAKITNAFKTESGSFLIDKLKLKPDSILSSSIKKITNDVSPEETAKLFSDCNHFCEVLSEQVISKMGLSDEISRKNFERSFKSELKTMICPLLDKIGSKMEKKFSEMKSKALS